MNIFDRVPTPENETHVQVLQNGQNRFVARMELLMEHRSEEVLHAYRGLAAERRELERKLAACRTTLESITHDMGASQAIHNLCAETLELTKP
jgi:hypothetical protein